MKTLRARLLRTLAISLVLVFLALWLLLVLGIRHTSEQQMLMHLSHDGEAVLSAVLVDGDGRASMDTRGIELVYEEPSSGHYYEVRVDGAPLRLSGSLEGRALAPAGTTAADFRTEGPGGQDLLVRAERRSVAGHEVAVFVAEDLGETDADIRRLSALALLIFAVAFPAALWLQALAVRRALEPLDRLRRQLAEVGAGQHAQVQGEVPLEIKPLVDELNRLLVLLQRRVQQSRTALGNLAHALKTPLASIVRSSEDARMPPPLREQVGSQAASMRERLERELRRARLAGPAAAAPGALFQPSSELRVLAQVVGSIYRDKALDIEVVAGEELLPFDREDMLELLGNLADNACKWARSRVRIEARTEGGEFVMTVSDDGPGCSEEEATRITQRGVRLDESAPGHGLGLAIVRDAVSFYGGRLAIARDLALGGFRAQVALPLPETHEAAHR